jgi:hypothetical protein
MKCNLSNYSKSSYCYLSEIHYLGKFYFFLKIRVLQNRQLWFSDLGSISPRRFLGLGLKTKKASVCRLHHKPKEGGRRGTRVDIWQLASSGSKSR